MFSANELIVATPDGRSFRLIEPFSFTAKNGDVITVPAGTTSDGASTPRPLWLTLPPFGDYWKAAFLHDYLYRDTQTPKDRCDDLLKEAMDCLGVNEFNAFRIYQGVNLFGWHAFNEDREEQQQKGE